MPVTFRARPDRDERVEGSGSVGWCNPRTQLSDTNRSQARAGRDALSYGLSGLLLRPSFLRRGSYSITTANSHAFLLVEALTRGGPLSDGLQDVGGHRSATLRRARGGSQTAFLRLSSPDAYRHLSIGFVRGDPPIMVSRVFAGAARADQPKLKSIKLCLRDCCSDVGKQSTSNDRRCANMLSRSKPAVSASAGASF